MRVKLARVPQLMRCRGTWMRSAQCKKSTRRRLKLSRMQRIRESRRSKRLKLNANSFFCKKLLWKRSLKRQSLNARAD